MATPIILPISTIGEQYAALLDQISGVKNIQSQNLVAGQIMNDTKGKDQHKALVWVLIRGMQGLGRRIEALENELADLGQENENRKVTMRLAGLT